LLLRGGIQLPDAGFKIDQHIVHVDVEDFPHGYNLLFFQIKNL
jgi:hypothetical protein